MIAALLLAVALRTASPLPEGEARIEVLQRERGEWVVVASNVKSIDRADVPRAVRLRVAGDPRFWWGEVAAGASEAVLHPYRALRCDGLRDGERVTLYVDEPLVVDRHAPMIAAVDGLACAHAASGSRCVPLEATATRIVFTGEPRDVRLLHVAPQRDEVVNVLTRGPIAIRPRKVASETVAGGEWRAIALHDAEWKDVIVDRDGAELARERYRGDALPPPPAYTRALSSSARGVTIRPLPRTDAHALLVVFESDRADVPLATASPDEAGHFALPTLGSGTYALKLLSATTRPERVIATVAAGVPLDVAFPLAPMARGRVVKTSGGGPADPVTIEVAPELSIRELAQHPDVVDRVRVTSAADDGRFAVALSDPGVYVLRARWGSATAERRLTVAKLDRDLDLGELVLSAGATLRATVDACPDGEAILIPVPDFSKPLSIGVIDLRRTRIAPDGTFHADGLTPGPWSLLLRCDGLASEAMPPTFIVPPGGDVIVDFTRAR